MPYKCTVCGKIYREGSDELKEILYKGGCSCGKKFLMYVRSIRDEADAKEGVKPSPESSEPEEEADDPLADLPKAEEGAEPSVAERKTVQPPDTEDTKEAHLEWLRREFVRMRNVDQPLYLGIETIRVIEEGKYQIDVPSLMAGKPLIVKTDEGVYYIDVPYAMTLSKKKEED